VKTSKVLSLSPRRERFSLICPDVHPRNGSQNSVFAKAADRLILRPYLWDRNPCATIFEGESKKRFVISPQPGLFTPSPKIRDFSPRHDEGTFPTKLPPFLDNLSI
jgi:hypothetical protein